MLPGVGSVFRPRLPLGHQPLPKPRELRHTFITNLARAGGHPRVTQSLARHCTITLTMDRYTHVLHEQEVDALSRLPDLYIRPTVVESNKTGTDGS